MNQFVKCLGTGTPFVVALAALVYGINSSPTVERVFLFGVLVLAVTGITAWVGMIIRMMQGKL